MNKLRTSLRPHPRDLRNILEGRASAMCWPVRQENTPEPGNMWQECLCREIDPADTPCMTCEARYGPSGFDGCYGYGDSLYIQEPWRLQWNESRELQVEYTWLGQPNGIGKTFPDTRLVSIEHMPEALQRYQLHRDRWQDSRHMPRWAARACVRLHSLTPRTVEEITTGEVRCLGFRQDDPLGASRRRLFLREWAQRYAQSPLSQRHVHRGIAGFSGKHPRMDIRYVPCKTSGETRVPKESCLCGIRSY